MQLLPVIFFEQMISAFLNLTSPEKKERNKLKSPSLIKFRQFFSRTKYILLVNKKKKQYYSLSHNYHNLVKQKK